MAESPPAQTRRRQGICAAGQTVLEGHHEHTPVRAFAPDGSRLFSTFGGQEAVKLWGIGTPQELLTLAGIDSNLNAARWSADGDVILAGPPWQAWTAPSWEEIKAAEARDPPSSDFGGRGKTEIRQP